MGLVANAAQIAALSHSMDDVCHRIQDLLGRYQEANNNMQPEFTGGAGSTNIVTSAEVAEAQLKVQTRFNHVNEALRGGATHYQNTDEDNQQQVAAVASQIIHHS